MMYWYSKTEKELVSIQSDIDELSRIAVARGLEGVSESLVNAIRLDSLDVVPVVPIYVYGTLRKGMSAHYLIKELSKKYPEFKPFSGNISGVALYGDTNLPYPMAKREKGASIYVERYLIAPSDIEILNRYEGAPQLYKLTEVEGGYIYLWNLGMKDKFKIESGDWEQYLKTVEK